MFGSVWLICNDLYSQCFVVVVVIANFVSFTDEEGNKEGK
jgi:hypothetical protein